MTIKNIFLDLETTGTDYLRHGIYQIGGVVKYENIYQEFEFKCDIFAEDEINPAAFDPQKTNVIPDDLRGYPDPMEIHDLFINTVLSKHIDRYDKQDKFWFINFGAEFDAKFLRRWMESCGDNYFGAWFWYPVIELQSLAGELLKEQRPKMENFQLATVCRTLGIPVDDSKTHTALYDAKLAMQIYEKTILKKAIDKAYQDAQKTSQEGKYHLRGARK